MRQFSNQNVIRNASDNRTLSSKIVCDKAKGKTNERERERNAQKRGVLHELIETVDINSVGVVLVVKRNILRRPVFKYH